MTDLDKSGFGFQRVRTYLGPSLGWVDELVQPTVDITVGGVHVVQPGESLLLVEVAAAVTIQLPDVIRWMQQTAYQPATGFDRSITVKDIGGNAANFNIVVAPFGQQAIDNLQQSTIISTARANVRFVPLLDMSGWAVQSNTGAGGGGGGGDVFKAGNNTFTGTNIFQNTVTVPTPLTADNSQNVATTAWVNLQGYITGVSLAPYALIASPTFTGDPKAPTPSPGDNDTSIATTAFVQAAIGALGTPAPVGAEYITASANATLTNERVLTNTASITWDFSTAGQAKASTAAGGGNVSSSGSPVNGQLAQWVTSTTITGVDGSTLYAPIASPLFTGDPRAPTPVTTDNDTSIATTAYVKANLANFQPLDADLTALSGLGGTNTIYYRSAPDIWSPVTYSGLSFSGGVLTVTAGGGNVNNNGTPTVGQVAVWTDATHIQGTLTLNNIVLTGDPQAPTPATADNDTSIATTAFVKAQGYAPLASPVFTGNPTAPTPTVGDNDTSLATTAFVTAAVAAVGGGVIGPPQGRLTLQSITPVMTTTQAAKTTIYYTPYCGNLVPITNNGVNFSMVTFSELLALTTDTTKSPAAIGANKINDWFVWNDAGTIRLSHGTDWATDTGPRQTFISMVNGIWLNSSPIANGPAGARGTYVGTTRSNASSQLDWILGAASVGGTPGNLAVWNCYNRVLATSTTQDTTANALAGGNPVQWLNSAGNRCNVVCGLAEDAFIADALGIIAAGSGGTAMVGIGFDSIAAYSGRGAYTGYTGAQQQAGKFETTMLGYHYFQMLGGAAAQNGTMYGAISGTGTSGLTVMGNM